MNKDKKRNSFIKNYCNKCVRKSDCRIILENLDIPEDGKCIFITKYSDVKKDMLRFQKFLNKYSIDGKIDSSGNIKPNKKFIKLLIKLLHDKHTSVR